MSYDVSFAVSAPNGDGWFEVGEEWISCNADAGDIVLAVTGSYPSYWTRKPCREIAHVLAEACEEIKAHADKYRPLERSQGDWGSVEAVAEFLNKVAAGCEKYPDGIVIVRIDMKG